MIGLVTASSNRANYGNPNINVTDIDTSGGITCSRTSGLVPFVIQVSASAVAATGTGIDFAYEDLEYSWDFGDPSGTETFTRPTDLATVNANYDQVGPEAAYCYKTAGTYTITLTIRGKTSNGWIVKKVTQSVTASAYTANFTVYFDSNAPGGGDGTTAATAYNTIANLHTDAFWTARKVNCTIKLARGSYWQDTAGMRLPNGAAIGAAMSGLRVEAYQGSYSASTSKPWIDVNGSSSSNLGIPCHFGTTSGSNAAFSKTDFVVRDVKFTATNCTFNTCLNISQGTGAIAPMTEIYLVNCDFVSQRGATATGSGTDVAILQALNGAVGINWGFWGGSVGAPLTGAVARCNIIGGSPTNWFTCFGLSIYGAVNDNTFDHFIYPEARTHSLYKWIAFGETGVGVSAQASFCINLNNNGYNLADGGYAQDTNFSFADYTLISECDNSRATNKAKFFAEGSSSNTPTATFTNTSADIALSIALGSAPAAGTPVAFRPDNGTKVLPVTSPQITTMTVYYILAGSTTTSIQISDTPGGTAIVAGANGTCHMMRTSFRNYVIEKCAASGMAGNGLISPQDVRSLTVRDCRFWGNTATLYAPSSWCRDVFKGKTYRNYIDFPNAAGAGTAFLNHATGWAASQQCTDNKIVDRRATAWFHTMDWTNMQVNGTVVDRNTYVTTLNTATFYDNVTSKTWAQYHAVFDLSVSSSPGTTSPWGSPSSWDDFD